MPLARVIAERLAVTAPLALMAMALTTVLALASDADDVMEPEGLARPAGLLFDNGLGG